MSQKLSLVQSANYVSRVLTADRRGVTGQVVIIDDYLYHLLSHSKGSHPCRSLKSTLPKAVRREPDGQGVWRHSSALMNTLRVLTLYEAPGENFSFGQGEAQRANAVLRERK